MRTAEEWAEEAWACYGDGAKGVMCPRCFVDAIVAAMAEAEARGFARGVESVLRGLEDGATACGDSQCCARRVIRALAAPADDKETPR